MLRPWPAEDGLLVRLRLVGGRLPVASLQRLLQVSVEFADGSVYLTTRANLQLRGLPGREGRLDPAVVAAIESTGLLPSRSHELVRNILVSPQTGYAGGASICARWRSGSMRCSVATRSWVGCRGASCLSSTTAAAT